MTFTAGLPALRIAYSLAGQSSPWCQILMGSTPAPGIIFSTLFLTFYSCVFIVICDLFSFTFVLITMHFHIFMLCYYLFTPA